MVFLTELFERIDKEKQSKIIQAAISEFASFGYNGANINQIAQNAQVSVGSIYKYFNDKEDLFLSMVQYGSSVLQAALDEILQGDEDILIKVEKTLRTVQKYSRENRDMIRLYHEMTTQSNPKLVKPAAYNMESFTARLYSGLIEKAQSDGEARTDFDPKLFAYLLDNLFMMFQFSYSCEYYQERFRLYAGDDIFDRDDFVVEQTLAFVKAAFSYQHK